MNVSITHSLISTEVRSALEPLTSNHGISLREVYSKAEELVPPLIAGAVTSAVGAFAAQHSLLFLCDPFGGINFDHLQHQVIVAPHATQVSTIVVTISAMDGVSPLMRKAIRGEVEGLGRYTSVRLYTSRALAGAREKAVEAAKVVLTVAYECLLEYTVNIFKRLNDETATMLYAELRKSISISLADQVWLYAFSNGQGFYIPDIRAQNTALSRLGERTIRTGRSPLALAADFMTHVLPFEKTYTKEALQLKKPLTGIFATAPYADGGMGITEQSVYHAAGLVTQPLSQFGTTIITAGYPIELSAQLQPTLAKLAPRLGQLLEARTGPLESQLSQLQQLASGGKASESGTWIDTLELKPNVFGVGLNLNALISMFQRRKRRKE